MPEITQPKPEAVIGERAGWVLMSLLLIGFVVFAGMAVLDRAKRTELEQLVRLAAVADTDYQALPVEGVAVLQKNSVPLFGGELKQARDYEMFKAGKDDSGKVTLYEFYFEGRTQTPGYWIKLGPESFVELKQKQAGQGAMP